MLIGNSWDPSRMLESKGRKLPGGVSRVDLSFLGLIVFFDLYSFLPGLNLGDASISAEGFESFSLGCSVKGDKSSLGSG